jgi:acetyltransferase-like isoleucine patch superfamily enzyme
MYENFIAHGELSRQPNTVIGLAQSKTTPALELKGSANVRSGTVLYANSRIGDNFQTGHNVLVREKSTIGKHVLIGTGTVVDGNMTIGNYVKIESNCYICTDMKIGNQCFFGPNVVCTNDMYPLKLRDTYKAIGPVIEDNVTIGGGVVLCPGVRIGSGSFIGAGTVVTKNIPKNSFVKGNPGRITELPKKLKDENMALSWRKYQDQETGKLC